MTRQAITEAAAVSAEFFTAERCGSLLDLCLHRLMPLRVPDLDEWLLDPEAYHLASSSLAAEESPRVSAEQLVATLLEEKTETMVPLLASLLADGVGQTAAAAAEAGTLRSATEVLEMPTEVLLWDARFVAAGQAATPLRDAGVDFTAWFTGTLGPCLTTLVAAGGGGGRDVPPVLRRRILWLIGMWMAEVADEMRPALYTALVQMLSSSGAAAAAGRQGSSTQGEVDAAVSLTLLRTLSAAVDSWDFNAAAFRPLVGPAVSGLYCMLSAFGELDARLQVMNLLYLVLQSVGAEGVGPCVDEVVAPLGAIWASAGDDAVGLLRKRVLNVLTLVVTSLPPGGAARLDPLVIPLISAATNVALPESSDYMMEDGLDLWSACLTRAPLYTAELHGLFPHLPAILARDLEHLAVAMKIVEEYVVLGAGPFLEAHAAAVTGLFNLVVTEVSPRGSKYVSAALEAILKRFPAEGADMLRRVGVLGKLVVASLEADADDRGDGHADPALMVHYMAIVARVAVTAPDHLRALLHSEVSDGSPAMVSARLAQLANMWIRRFDLIAPNSSVAPWHRKVVALALASLVAVDPPGTLPRLVEIVNVCVDVLSEQAPGASPAGSPGAGPVPSPAEALALEALEATAGSDLYTANLRAMVTGDAVLTIDLRAFLSAKLGEAQASAGAEALQLALAAVDPALLAQLRG